ncbi:MAG: substrate-binding domain-containing protein, partial [Rhodospirillales bacterium]|nr:substrate-binding domain-containing protein [Rhodospirillales bacterium]
SAIKAGLGIGLLPTYSCEFLDGVVPLDLGLRTYSELHLVFHPEIQNTARVRTVIEWIKDLFDHETWPWFRDEFHAPTRPKSSTGTRVTVD